MTAPPRMRRRELTSLLAVSGGVLLAGGCGPRPVPTSPEVARDPLAELDAAHWDARSAQELRALPVQGDGAELSAWADLGADDAVLDPARDLLAGFVEAAYLSPARLRELDDEGDHDHISARSPEFWRDSLREAWDRGERMFYAVDLAAPFRTVGRPAIASDWFRAEQDGAAVLALGATVAWTVLETDTRAVGVMAHRLGILADIGEGGDLLGAGIRVTVHGLDGCGVEEAEGLLVPALGGDERHRSVQEATREQIIASPRIALEDLLDAESAVFAADDLTHLRCD